VPLLTSELTVMLLSQLIPNAQDLLALEPEELAGALLEVLNSYSDMQSGNLNRYNFSISPDAVQGYPSGQHTHIRQAVMEAWAWLEREGLIVPRVGQQGEWVAVSRRGKQLAGRGGLDAYRKAGMLPKALLHPIISEKVAAPFMRGDYDTAVFQAFKEVEVAVRAAAGYAATDLGVPMMRRAFDVNSGPLTDSSEPASERQALSDLFAGAIGRFKNPGSHRNVAIGDPTEASELLMFASRLLRIVDARKSTTQPSPPTAGP
jgi:uncharacterized protein (TIGR02391 family)